MDTTETTSTGAMKTLFVSDMDGTLLGADSQLSPFTAGALNRLITQCGMRFTVATARTPATVVPLMSNVHADLPFVVMSGAALYDPIEGAFHAVQVIPEAAVTAVVEAFAHEGLSPLIYRRHGSRLQVYHCGRLSDAEKLFVDQRRHLPLKDFILDCADYTVGAGNDAMLIFAMNDYNRIERVAADIRSLAYVEVMCYHDIFNPATGLLEVYRAGTSKAAAITRLARKIGAERVVAFGDNRNDITMLQAADLAVAVDRAVPEVKAVADTVIGANTDNAVARYLLQQFNQL